MKKELVGISAELRNNYAIILTASDADGEDTSITVPSEDIRQVYGQSCADWYEENGDRESSLWELFNAVAGISVT